MSQYVVRRDGREVPFDQGRVADSIHHAALAVGHADLFLAEEVAEAVACHFAREDDRRAPDLDEVQDLVEQVLFDTGQIEIARRFMAERARRVEARERVRVRRRAVQAADPTDAELLVDPLTSEELLPWQRERIARALEIEAGIETSIAEEISVAVEEKIFASGLSRISTSLVRALVDNELFERDLASSVPGQQLLGMPAHDLERLVLARSRENASASTHTPESIGRAISELTLRRYALREIFSFEVASAHLDGRLHIHGLGQSLRLGAVVHDLGDLISRGLDFQGVQAVSASARHVATLTGQLQTYLRAMSAFFAGPQGVAHLNLSYAPFIEGLGDEELYQEAQELLYATAQSGAAQGGKALAVDFNLVLETPAHLRGFPLPGPGGEPTERLAEEYEVSARRFARALLEAWGDGDLRGAPFSFPRCVLQVPMQGELADDAGVEELLRLAAEVSTRTGSVLFAFDRGGVDGSHPVPGAAPDPIRGASVCHGQTVTINLPRVVQRSIEATAASSASEIDGEDVDRVILEDEIRSIVDLAVHACAERRQYLMRLASSAELPLWEIGRSRRGAGPRVDFYRLELHVGIIGLAEALELSPQDRGLAEFLLRKVAERAAAQVSMLGLVIGLVEAPCEGSSRRLARIDLRLREDGAPPRAGARREPALRGNPASGDVYYTRGSSLPEEAAAPLSERLAVEGARQSFASAGATSAVHPRGRPMTVEEAMTILAFTRRRTGVRALCIAPLLVVCDDCRRTTVATGPLREGALAVTARCPSCFSYTASLVTCVAGGPARLADANASKVLEVAARSRGQHEVDAAMRDESRDEHSQTDGCAGSREPAR